VTIYNQLKNYFLSHNVEFNTLTPSTWKNRD